MSQTMDYLPSASESPVVMRFIEDKETRTRQYGQSVIRDGYAYSDSLYEMVRKNSGRKTILKGPARNTANVRKLEENSLLVRFITFMRLDGYNAPTGFAGEALLEQHINPQYPLTIDWQVVPYDNCLRFFPYIASEYKIQDSRFGNLPCGNDELVHEYLLNIGIEPREIHPPIFQMPSAPWDAAYVRGHKTLPIQLGLDYFCFAHEGFKVIGEYLQELAKAQAENGFIPLTPWFVPSYFGEEPLTLEPSHVSQIDPTDIEKFRIELQNLQTECYEACK